MDVYRERELKFDVPAGFEVPDAADVLPGTEIVRRTVALSSTYHDTFGHDLLANRVTLRRRTGDTDTGWQLKIPAGSARDEISAPLAPGVVTGTEVEHPVPASLAELLTGIVRPAELTPVARLDTERRLTRVHRDGELVVEIADDSVTATSSDVVRWREVEIELGPAGDEKDLARFARLLRGAGARASRSGSKLAHALGQDAPAVTRSPAGTLVADHLAQSHRALVAGDIALRRDGAGSAAAVHDVRAAVRRIRSVLRVFRDVLGGTGTAAALSTSARALDAELSWYQHLLGEVRDRQVQRAGFTAALVELPPELVLGPVAARLEQMLLSEQLKAQAAVTAALKTNRYRRMLTGVASLGAGEPVVPGTTRTRLRTIAESSSRTAARRLRSARESGDPAQLHRARKAVRRARYAAELVGRSPKTISRFERVQDVLGAHQDAVITADLARRAGAAAGSTPGENGFTFGLLYQRALDQARQLRGDVSSLRIPR